MQPLNLWNPWNSSPPAATVVESACVLAPAPTQSAAVLVACIPPSAVHTAPVLASRAFPQRNPSRIH